MMGSKSTRHNGFEGMGEMWLIIVNRTVGCSLNASAKVIAAVGPWAWRWTWFVDIESGTST